jgi:FKBP-type peptidyl-prolyl cis-trans isomerase FkpA
MKQTIFTLLLLSTIGLISCRKHDNQPNIKQYDEQQIKSYIAANNITGMVQDATGGDTSGIYYKIILQPNPADTAGTALNYTDDISFVFTLRSFDGHYVSSDTIENHYQGFLGHIVSDALPVGLELAILNDLKYTGSSMRVLIPSDLAYGINGYGSGSITNTSTRIAGNQCLDYYVHLIATQPDLAHRQATYDDKVIKNYLAANGLSGTYLTDTITSDTSGGHRGFPQTVYYAITTPGTGTVPISDNTTAEVTYNGRLLNNVAFDTEVEADSASVQIPELIKGVSTILKRHAVQGTTISMLMPSALGYGTVAQTGIPANSPLRFEFRILNVYNY